LICNCGYCKKRRKKSEVKIEYVSISEKIKELAENNINLIIAVPSPEISFPSIFQVKKNLFF
jgi:hypothetical protein